MVGEYFLGVQVDLDRRVDEVVGIEFNVLGVTEFRILVIPGPRRNSDTSVKVLRRRRMITSAMARQRYLPRSIS